MGYSGLYLPFKLNRPLTEEEINNQLQQDFSGMGTASFQALDDGVVIKMNSTYLELVDKYYKDRGLPDFAGFILSSVSFIFIFAVIFIVVFRPNSAFELNFQNLVSVIIMIIIASFFCFFTFSLLLKTWFTWTHYPVRFNRKTQMVHVFKLDGTILSLPWQDVFFTRVKAGLDRVEHNIHGNILAADKKTVLDTFSLGFSNSRRDLVSNWAFIYSYMTVDNCLEDLRDIIALCPPIAEKKESYLFGLQYLIRVGSRLEWVFLPFKFPLGGMFSLARYIGMRTCKIPRWSAEVEADCQVDPNDPINVSAANNPKHLWRYILANQTLADYNALYQRQTQAMERLREKVQAHKKQSEGD